MAFWDFLPFVGDNPKAKVQTPTRSKPKYNSFWERAGDIFEANSPQDQYVREQRGQPKNYSESRQDSFWARNTLTPESMVRNPVRTTTQVAKKAVGAGAGLARETLIKPFVTLGMSAAEQGDDQALSAVKGTVAKLRAMPYEERKKAIEESGFKYVMENRGITDPTDENLDALVQTQVKKDEENTNTVTPSGRFQKAILGNEPIQTYQERQKGAKKEYEEGTSLLNQVTGRETREGFAGPLSFIGLGLSAGLDLTPGGGGKKKAAEQLVEEGGEQLAKRAGKEVIEDVVTSKPRKFIQTVAEKGPTTEAMKDAAKGISPETYVQKPNAKLMEDIKLQIRQDYDAAKSRVLDSDGPISDEETAIGQQLMMKAMNEGRTKDFTDILEKLDVRLRESGRGIQAASIWGRLSPEGMLLFAKRQIDKANESRGWIAKRTKDELQLDPDAAKEISDIMKTAENLPGGRVGDLAGAINTRLEGTAPTIGGSDILRSVQDSISDLQQALPLEGMDNIGGEVSNVSRGIAKGVEKAAAPARVKKKADELVKQIVRKVREEMLEPTPGAKPRPAKDVIQEMIRRDPVAQEAYPMAQELLRGRYANAPEMMEALEKFFATNLDLPVAGSTLDRGILEELKANQTSVAQIIRDSIKSQRNITESVTRELVGAGADEPTARAFAQEIERRLGGQIADAKKKALEAMAKEAPERARKTFMDKINKLSNLGALDDSDYIELARKQLDLPDLEPDVAKRLSELSQLAQDNPQRADEYAMEALKVINEQIPVGVSEVIDSMRYTNLLSNPRTQARNTISNLFNTMITRPATLATQATTDWFGATLTGADRKYYLSEVPEYYRGMFNSFADAIEASKGAWLGNTPIASPDLKDLKAVRSQRLPKALTAVPRFMEAQDRFFSTLLAAGEYASLRSSGVPDETAKGLARQAAEYSLFRSAVDPKNKTGQGELLSKIDQFTDLVGRFGQAHKSFRWFVPFIKTPMNVTKQMIEFSPMGFATMPGSARKNEQAAKAIMGTTITAMGAKMALDGNVTWDVPKNEEDRQRFYAEGKRPYSVKIGNTWVPMIYFGPWSLALGLPAALKDANDEAPMDASAVDRATASVANVARFFSQQTYVQGVANFVDVISGNTDDNIPEALGFTASQAIPLAGLQRYISSIVDPVYRKASGFVDSLTQGIPGISKGMEPYTDMSGEPATRNWSDFLAPYTLGLPPAEADTRALLSAEEDFYKEYRRAAAGRSKVNDEISALIGEGKDSEAQKKAEEWNSRYESAFDDWFKEYPEYAQDETLLKDFEAGKINLTPRSTKSRRSRQKTKKQQQEETRLRYNL